MSATDSGVRGLDLNLDENRARIASECVIDVKPVLKASFRGPRLTAHLIDVCDKSDQRADGGREGLL